MTYPCLGRRFARALDLQGRYAQVEPLYKEVLAIRQKVRGVEHAEVATDLSNLGGLYNKLGRSAEAGVHLKHRPLTHLARTRACVVFAAAYGTDLAGTLQRRVAPDMDFRQGFGGTK
jgi:hypothetical protein